MSLRVEIEGPDGGHILHITPPTVSPDALEHARAAQRRGYLPL